MCNRDRSAARSPSPLAGAPLWRENRARKKRGRSSPLLSHASAARGGGGIMGKGGAEASCVRRLPRGGTSGGPRQADAALGSNRMARGVRCGRCRGDTTGRWVGGERRRASAYVPVHPFLDGQVASRRGRPRASRWVSQRHAAPDGHSMSAVHRFCFLSSGRWSSVLYRGENIHDGALLACIHRRHCNTCREV